MLDPPAGPTLSGLQCQQPSGAGDAGNSGCQAKDQSEGQVSSFKAEVPSLAWEHFGNRVCSEMVKARCGGESRDVEAGFGETRKRRRGQMQMRAWSAFPGKWLCMLSHPRPEPLGSRGSQTT